MTTQSVAEQVWQQLEDQLDGGTSPPLRVLLATDGTEAARAAEDFLRELVLPAGSAVEALTVLDAPEWRVPASLAGAEQEWADRITREAQARLQAPGVQLSRAVRRGATAEQIIDAADEFHADLIVLGSHGRSGLERFLLGSVAEKVARFARQPVLVARRPGRVLRKVLVALDGSDHAGRALRMAARMPFPAEAEVTLCHVMRPYYAPLGPEYIPEMDRLLLEVQECQRKDAVKLLDAAGDDMLRWRKPATKVLLEGDPADQVLRLGAEQQADLIVLGAKGVSGFEALLVGSVADRVLKHAHCSVLLVR